jgi:hypothetical protein
MTRGAPLLRPEFGPTLPELVSGRFSVSRRAVTIALVVSVVVIVVAIKVALGIGRSQVTVHGTPSFNLVYKTAQLHRVPLQPGELVRLAGARAHVSVSLTVRHANLPPYSGDVLSGQLPLYASTYVDQLKAQLPHFLLSDEGKARINTFQGYEIGYQSGPRGHRTYWRDVFLLPAPDKPKQAIVMRLRQTFSGRTGPRDRALVQAAKAAYQSFRFGTRRPLFSGG